MRLVLIRREAEIARLVMALDFEAELHRAGAQDEIVQARHLALPAEPTDPPILEAADSSQTFGNSANVRAVMASMAWSGMRSIIPAPNKAGVFRRVLESENAWNCPPTSSPARDSAKSGLVPNRWRTPLPIDRSPVWCLTVLMRKRSALASFGGSPASTGVMISTSCARATATRSPLVVTLDATNPH